MKKILISFTLLCLSLGFSELYAQNKHALLIGIDKYIYDEPAVVATLGTANAVPPRRWSDLRGAVNDARNMKELLVSRFGFDRDNIHTLYNEEATRDNILAAIQQYIIDIPEPGDEVFFFYAGHGSQVPNSLSDELNKLDETLVPTDAFFGAPDIRDKELRKLFNNALDKDVRLTLIFDSCHSGSITRGVPSGIAERKIDPALYDVADASLNNLPSPEERGALVLSSARDEQTAKERYNRQTDAITGIFTDSFIRVVRESAPNEPVSRIMARVNAIVSSSISDQDPVLAGLPERVNAPLFGTEADADDAVYAGVLQRAGNIVVLQGGRAIGLNNGAVLQHHTQHENPVEIRVTQLNQLTEAIAEIISGDASSVKEGDLFKVVSFGINEAEPFLVYLPPSAGTYDALLSMARNAFTDAERAGMTWVVDPLSKQEQFAYVHYTGGSWMNEFFGEQPVQGEIVQAISAQRSFDAEPSVFVHFPPTDDIRSNFDFVKDERSMIGVAESRDQADYILTGYYNPRTDQLEYRWVRPNATMDEVNRSVFPVQTESVRLSSQNPRAAYTELNRQINAISRIKGWLDLEAPPGNRFPFTMAFRNTSTGEIIESGHLSVGSYDLILQNTMGSHPRAFDSHHVYIFFADNSGRMGLLYPQTSSSSALPTGEMINSDEGIPAEISLLTVPIEAPTAVNTVFMLTSKVPLTNPGVFNQQPVVGVRSGTRAPGMSPLDALISDRTTATRTFGSPPVVDWSLSRLFVTTGSKP